jgi:ABC-type branched-subunit amino acid transport system substrate-binding protein
MKRTRLFVAGLLAFSLLAAACGDDDDGDSTTATTEGNTATTTGGDTATTTGGGGDCSLDEPVKIVALVEKPPEGPNALAAYDEGMQMALEDLDNELCGQEIEFDRLPASPTDGSAALNAYLQALDEDPNATMGLPSSTAVLAVAPEVKKAGIPMIYWSVAPQAFSDGEVGSEWGFMIRPRNTGIATLQVDYAMNELGAKNIGLLCANLAFGTQGCDAAAAQIEKNGGKVVARESNETTDTDLTAKVIALKNANPDAVIAFTFPNNLVVLYNQAADQGLNVPIFGGSSAGLIIGAVNENARKNVWGTDDCVPSTDPAAADWKAKYEEKFGKKMIGSGYNIAESYDSIMLYAEAIKAANSADPKDIADALRSLDYKGVCADYKADAGQGLHHSTDIVQFDDAGLAKSVKKVDVPAPS